MKKIILLSTIIFLSYTLQGCVAQLAVGVAATAVSVPFQVTGQVVDAISSD